MMTLNTNQIKIQFVHLKNSIKNSKSKERLEEVRSIEYWMISNLIICIGSYGVVFKAEKVGDNDFDENGKIN